MTRFTICDDEPEHGRLIGKYIKTEYAKHVPETDTAEVVVYQSPQEMLDEVEWIRYCKGDTQIK